MRLTVDKSFSVHVNGQSVGLIKDVEIEVPDPAAVEMPIGLPEVEFSFATLNRIIVDRDPTPFGSVKRMLLGTVPYVRSDRLAFLGR